MISSKITPDAYSTTALNPYEPMPTGLPGLGGLGNIGSLIQTLLNAKRQREKDQMKRQQSMMREDKPTIRSSDYLHKREDPNAGLRREAEGKHLFAEINGPNKVLIPTGYGHMLQEDVSSLPWSMRPGNTQMAADNAPADEASGTGEPFMDWAAFTDFQKNATGTREPARAAAQPNPQANLMKLLQMMGQQQQ